MRRLSQEIKSVAPPMPLLPLSRAPGSVLTGAPAPASSRISQSSLSWEFLLSRLAFWSSLLFLGPSETPLPCAGCLLFCSLPSGLELPAREIWAWPKPLGKHGRQAGCSRRFSLCPPFLPQLLPLPVQTLSGLRRAQRGQRCSIVG